VTLRAITSIAVFFSLPLDSAGNDRAPLSPYFRAQFIRRSAHHSLKFASHHALAAFSPADHRQKRLSPRPCAARSAPNNPHSARG
jgi:hypothetical protein